MELDVDDTDEPELVSVPWSEGSPRFSGWGLPGSDLGGFFGSSLIQKGRSIKNQKMLIISNNNMICIILYLYYFNVKCVCT